MSRTTHPIEHAVERAHVWLADVARELGTGDRDFAYRALRAWLHAVRDRLTVQDGAHLAAQLPDLFRGVFYEGWQPDLLPIKRNEDEFAAAFADEAGIDPDEVQKVAWLVSSALDQHVAGLDKVGQRLPRSIRELLIPGF